MKYESDHGFHRAFLGQLAARMKPHCYIELGLGTDPAILNVGEHCFKAYGVDRKVEKFAAPPNSVILEMSTDEFFAAYSDTIEPPELVFIDADHSKDQVLKDLEAVAAIAGDNCIVVLHDTFPENLEQTRPGLCSDSYRVAEYLAASKTWEVVTLPIPPGLTICRLNPKSLL